MSEDVYVIGRGWFNMPCWNALSVEQQQQLITVGNLPIGYRPEGDACVLGAEVCIETQDDVAPGPRFYCRPCAIDFLTDRRLADGEKLMRPPAKNPCNDCPWRRDAIPGWLGPHTAEEWTQMAHADGQIACHQTIPADTPEDGSDLDQMTACAGAAIFRANIAKSPRPLRGLPEYRLAADRERVFSWDDEFIAYHTDRRLAP